MSSDELRVPSQRTDEDEADEPELRSPRVDDEYAAAVPGAVTSPEEEDDDTPYRDPYAGTGGDMLAEPEPEPEPEHQPDPAHTPAVSDEAPAPAVSGEAPAHAAPDDVALFDQDPIQVQARWRDLQASFVDDPSEAVERADGLVGEVVESLTSTLANRTDALRDRWQGTDTPDTEQLRLALREYRNVLERLLALSSESPPSQGMR
ncbi:hypothetical protein ACFLIM_02500 [Nonomuraea sp. M3C6]|uniref:Uncharacterized protein n=1 Tax=Nonomuraea marmarensis TaxID=3351344 RepID=A0ABW7A405_9ACTN